MEDDGGDAACWLSNVCEVCGALADPTEPHQCREPARFVEVDESGRRTASEAGH